MRIAWLIAGAVLLVLGLGWLVYILGGVFSLKEGFRSVGDLWGPMAFHAVTMTLGSFCIGKAASSRQKAAAEMWSVAQGNNVFSPTSRVGFSELLDRRL